MELLFVLLLHEIAQVVLDLVDQQDAGLDLARSFAGRTLLDGGDIRLRAHALPGDLHQTELARRQDGVLGAVAFHLRAQLLVQGLPVVRVVQVDEVDHDDAAHIAQAQLPATSVAASRFTCRALFSWLPSLSARTRPPLFTSITCMASVCSTMR